jgi:galactose mutarotase-like enzyme
VRTVERVSSGERAVGELWKLADDDARSEVTVAPQRGALVTSFRIGERELLYLDATTLNDATKNVRGGIPVLFPTPGKLADDAWSWGGRHGSLKQHGFARNLPWAVTGSSATDSADVTLRLESNAVTRAGYPWSFSAELTFSLAGTRLTLISRIANEDEETLPFALGYHPYFRVTDKARAHVDLRPTRVFDNVTKQTGAYNGIDLSAPEVDLHALDHPTSQSSLDFGDGSRLKLLGSRDFSLWVVWTLAGKDFVCLEPWTAPGNALNTGDKLRELEPGAAHESRLTLEFG